MSNDKGTSGSHRIIGAAVLFLLCGVPPLFGQDAVGYADTQVVPRSATFVTVVLSSGALGLLNWAGIFLWAFLSIPLGIASIVLCADLRSRQCPLVTKLLVIGLVWTFILGWVGVAQGTISAFSMLSSAPDVGVLAMNISHAVFSVAGALTVCQQYLLFLLISTVIVHFKQKKMLQHPQISAMRRGVTPPPVPERVTPR